MSDEKPAEKPPSTLEEEMNALSFIVRTLLMLDPHTLSRVMGYLIDRFGTAGRRV